MMILLNGMICSELILIYKIMMLLEENGSYKICQAYIKLKANLESLI